MKKLKIFIIISIIFQSYSFGAYLKDVPTTIKQPNGQIINCFATGDEYYNWVHDKDGYTIVQNRITGYYCYAILVEGELVASQYVVGTVSPQSVNLTPNVNISAAKMLEIRNASILNSPQKEVLQNSAKGAIGTLNNIVIYIRFADQTEFPSVQGTTYTPMFNSTSSGYNSMRNYFREVSYNQVDIVSHFYPVNNGTAILSYQDSQNRDFYLTNDYRGLLLVNAINYVKNQIPTSLNIDSNNDGKVDNICFIIRGEHESNTFLWPHRSILYGSTINGKKVGYYNVQIESLLLSTGGWYGNSVLCHEMGHTFGAPDLYHNHTGGTDMQPVETWDVMGDNPNPPPHMGAYIKHKYGHWISSIPSITTSGTYTLQPLTSSTNNCYKIPIKNSSQYLVVEYRKKTGPFESSLHGSGLIIYRINDTIKGNRDGRNISGGVLDEVYIFRPNGKINPPNSKGEINNAHFSQTMGRTTFSNTTNPRCFISNDNNGNIYIKNIRENSNGTLSFDIRFCDNTNVTYSNTSNLPSLTNASNNIQTSNTVIVKSQDNVTFEAGNEITLGAGFEIQQGGTFEININGCGEK